MNKQCVRHWKNVLLLAAMLGASGLMAYERSALLPVDPYVLVRISSVAACSNAIQALPIGKLWKDDGFQNFLGHPNFMAIMRSMSETNSMSKEQTHLQDELWRLLKGEVILAIDQNQDNAAAGAAGRNKGTNADLNMDLTFAAVTEFSSDDYNKMLALEQRLADIDQQKIQRSHVDFQGQDIVFTVRKEYDGNEIKTWQTFVNGVLIESDRKEWVESTIARVKREGAPTTGQPETPGMEITLSGSKIRASLEKIITNFKMPTPGAGSSGADDQVEPVGPVNTNPKTNAAAIMKALGLDTLKTFKMTVKLEPAQTRTTMMVDRGSARHGIWTFIEAQPAPADVKLPFVPGDTISFGVERANYPALWNELPAVLRALDPQLEMTLDMFQTMAGINVSSDLMAHLDTLCISLQTEKDQMLVALQLKNAIAMATTLKQFLVAPDPAAPMQRPGLGAKEEEFRGVSLFTWQSKSDQSIGLAVAGNMLYIGESELIRGIIRAQTADKPVEDAFFRSDIYRNMLKNKPDKAMGYRLINLEAMIRSMLSEENVAKMKQTLAMTLSAPDENNSSPVFDKFLRGIDFTKMPAADKIAAFFGPVYGYATVNGDRLEYQWLIQDAAAK